MDIKEDWLLRELAEYVDQDEMKTCQALIRSLSYLMLGLRPDLAFQINMLV